MRKQLTPSLVLSVIAIVMATSGISIAASTAITGKQIKDSSITGADIKNNTLTGNDIKDLSSGDIKNASLTGDDVKDHSLSLADFSGSPPAGPPGATGPQGPGGPAGATGATGAPGTNAAPQVLITRHGGAPNFPTFPPPANPTQTAFTETITVVSAGYYTLGGATQVDQSSCPSATCTFRVGTFIDGQGVDGSGVDITLDSTQTSTQYAQIFVVPAIQLSAGAHMISMRLEQTAGPSAGAVDVVSHDLQVTGPFVISG